MDLKALKTYSLATRKSKVRITDFAKPWRKGSGFSKFISGLPDILAGNHVRSVISAVVKAYQNNRPVVFAMGAHVIKVGLAPIVIDLMERGIITAIAMNGAGIIHDVESALAGKTSEDVPEGLCIGSIPKREDPADVLVSKTGKSFTELRAKARIGTSSLRRAAQLRHARPDIVIVPLRGNLDTRLKKLETENLDAVVLAAAGVKRLGLEKRITEVLHKDVMLPAVGQGALCIETRQHDEDMVSKVQVLDDVKTRTAVTAERAFLNRLGGSCQVPIAGYGRIDGERIVLRGLVSDLLGKRVVQDKMEGDAGDAEAIGIALAERLLSMGAEDILEQLKLTARENVSVGSV